MAQLSVMKLRMVLMIKGANTMKTAICTTDGQLRTA